MRRPAVNWMLSSGRQGGARRHGQVGGQPLGIAERNHPGIVEQQEIKHRAEEVRLSGPGGKIALGQAGRAEKERQQRFVPDQPAKCPQPDHLGLVPAESRHLLHFQRPGKQLLTKAKKG